MSVVQKPKLKKYFNDNDIEELIFLLAKLSKIIDIKFRVQDCRDKKDNFILEIGINGGADMIVTEDKDLLLLDPYKNIRIVKYKEFLKIIELSKQ
jgi:uncharacterized protein